MSADILMVVVLVIGVGIGMAVYHFFFRLSHQEKILKEQLHHTQKAFKEYQLKVSNHLNQSAGLMNALATNFDELHDHILQASVNLNLDEHKQSILQPDPHAAYVSAAEDIDGEQVTEFHPSQVEPIPAEKPVRPPRDYV